MNSMLVPGAWWPVSRQTNALGPELADVRERGTPVRDVGVVERRLEELVLEHQPLVVAEVGVDLVERLEQPLLPRADVALARVVRPVGQPDLEVSRAGAVHDVDALDVVVDRSPPDGLLRVGERPELVLVVLERVRVDRPQTHPERLRVGGESAVVVDLVPGNVQRDARCETGQRVDLGRVGDLLERVARHARLGEHLEPGPGVAERPRRQLDLLLLEPGEDRCVQHVHGQLPPSRRRPWTSACGSICGFPASGRPGPSRGASRNLGRWPASTRRTSSTMRSTNRGSAAAVTPAMCGERKTLGSDRSIDD